MKTEFKSDTPNETGSVEGLLPLPFDKMLKTFSARYWVIVDNGQGLEILGDSATFVIPSRCLNLVTDEINEAGEGYTIQLQGVDNNSVRNYRVYYDSKGRAVEAQESFRDFIRNKNVYLGNEYLTRSMTEKRFKNVGAAEESTEAVVIEKNIIPEEKKPSLFKRFFSLFRK